MKEQRVTEILTNHRHLVDPNHNAGIVPVAQQQQQQQTQQDKDKAKKNKDTNCCPLM